MINTLSVAIPLIYCFCYIYCFICCLLKIFLSFYKLFIFLQLKIVFLMLVNLKKTITNSISKKRMIFYYLEYLQISDKFLYKKNCN